MAGEGTTNPLWDFSLSVYRGEVVEICLELQDRCGADVNLLLYAAWMAAHGRPLSPGHLAQQLRETGEWRERVLSPLRSLRRALRGYTPARPLRDGLASLELQAERRQQEMILALYLRIGPPAAPGDWLAENLLTVAANTGVEPARGRELALRLAVLLERDSGVAPSSGG